MKNIRWLAVFAWILGCSESTGLIVEVSRDSSAPASLDRLEFVIGLSEGDGAKPGTYPSDTASPLKDIPLAGRDLLTDPYRLLLTDPSHDGKGVMVAALGYQGNEPVAFGAFAQPQAFIDGKVILVPVVLTGTHPETLVQTQTGCLSWPQGEGSAQIVATDDEDCDGDAKDVDCDDQNAEVGPSQQEICRNDIDDNCNQATDEEVDNDKDGVSNCDDCDDANKERFPGNQEVCDGIDNDCNDKCDDGVLDFDGDFYNTCPSGEKILDDGSCKVIGVIDCDDKDPDVHPEEPEVCDGKDQDCDGECDETFDEDLDTFTPCGTIVGQCGPMREKFVDCNPDLGTVHPFATEVCDGYDTNCDGLFASPHQLCFVESGDAQSCLAGQRDCDDDKSDGGDYGLGEECRPGSGETLVVDKAVCQAYPLCLEPDPWTCAAAEAARERFECTLYHLGTGALCFPRTENFTSPNPTATKCRYSLVGGFTQAHYKVALKSSNSGDATAIDACSGSFLVIDKRDIVPQPDDIFLLYSDDTAATSGILEVVLTPKLVAQCPEAGGLSCTRMP